MLRFLSNLAGTLLDVFRIQHAALDASALSEERVLALPDKDGTLATLDDATDAASAAISAHVAESDPHTQYLRKSQNLADLADAATARSNLSLGALATLSTVSTSQIDNDAVTDAKLRNSAALSVIGRSANSSGDPADIAAGSDHQVLRRSGTTLGFGAVNLAQSAAVTGTLAVGNGGTGAATLTGYVKGNGTSAFTASATIPASDLTDVVTTNTTQTITGQKTLTASTTVTGANLTLNNANGRVQLGASADFTQIYSGTQDFAAWKSLRIKANSNHHIDLNANGVEITGPLSATGDVSTRTTAPLVIADSNSFAAGGNGTGFAIRRSASGRLAGNTWELTNTILSGGSSGSDYQTDFLDLRGRASASDSTLTRRLRINPNTGLFDFTGAITATTTVTAAKSLLVDDVYQLTAVTSGSQTRSMDLANGSVQTISMNTDFTLNVTGPSSKFGKCVLYVYNAHGSLECEVFAGTGFANNPKPSLTLLAGRTLRIDCDWDGANAWITSLERANFDARPT